MTTARRQHIGVDQYGQTYWLGRHPRKELLQQLGRSRAAKLYRNDTSLRGYHHVGYIIAGLWIELFEVKSFRQAADLQGVV